MNESGLKRKREVADNPLTSSKRARSEIILSEGTIAGTDVWPIERLVKGLNMDTINSHFNLNDLKEFCRERRINVHGLKKSKIIGKILAYLAKDN